MENMKNERSMLRSPIPSQEMSLRLRERLTINGSSQPTSYRQDGSYRSVGLNFGHDFSLPRIPGVSLQVAFLPVPKPLR